MGEYQSAEVVPSAAYGLAAREAWVVRIIQALHDFADQQDVAKAQDALGQACLDEGACR